MTKFKVILALFTTIGTFLTLDNFFYQKPPVMCSIYQPDSLTGQSLIPNRVCQEKTSEFEVEYKINEFGLRDFPITYEKPEDTFRILFLGDSFTQGIGVGVRDTMAKVLERSLNEGTKGKYQTINGGNAAFAPVQEYSFLINKGITFNPDLVILNLNSGDFLEEIATSRNLIYENGNFSFSVEESQPPNFLKSFLENNSLSYNVFLENRERLWKMKGRIVAFLRQEDPPGYVFSGIDAKPGDIEHDLFSISRELGEEDFEKLFGPVSERVIAMKDFLKKRQIPLVLVVIPHGHQVGSSQWISGRNVYKLTDSKYPRTVFERLKQFAKDNEIFYVDPSDKLKNYLGDNPGDKLYFDYDGHLTEKGNSLVAAAIHDFLLENRSLISID